MSAGRRRLDHVAALCLMAYSALAVLADDHALDWCTVDGGGAMHATGGVFELSGTIGQPDAGTLMTGGDFELSGGFWTTPACWCLSDVNHDGRRDGHDVQNFIDCLLAGGSDCSCADVDANGVLNLADVAVFVDDLLAGGACP